MSYWKSTTADRRRARAVFSSATPDASSDVNAAALQWGGVVVAIAAGAVIAYFIAAWVIASLIGPGGNALLPLTVLLATPCARALRQRNVLRRRLRTSAQQAA